MPVKGDFNQLQCSALCFDHNNYPVFVNTNLHFHSKIFTHKLFPMYKPEFCWRKNIKRGMIDHCARVSVVRRWVIL